MWHRLKQDAGAFETSVHTTTMLRPSTASQVPAPAIWDRGEEGARIGGPCFVDQRPRSSATRLALIGRRSRHWNSRQTATLPFPSRASDTAKKMLLASVSP